MNITRQDSGKLGGLREVFFVDLTDVVTMPDCDGLIALGDVVLRGGVSWRKIEGQVYTPHLDGESESSAAGSAVKLSVEGFWAGDHPDATAQFARMHGRQFLVLVREVAGGDCRLAGDPFGGLRFESKYRSGDKVANSRGTSWSFAGRTRRPALYYAGAFQVEDGDLETGAGSGGSSGGGSSTGGSSAPAVSQLTIPYADAVSLSSTGQLRPGLTYRITNRPYGRPDILVDAADAYQFEEDAAEFTDGTPTGGKYTLIPDGFVVDESVTFVVAIPYINLFNLAGDELMYPGQLYDVYARPTSNTRILVRASTTYALYAGPLDALMVPVPTAQNPSPAPVPGGYVLATDAFTYAPTPHAQNTDAGTTLASFIVQLHSQNQEPGIQRTVLGFGTAQNDRVTAFALKWQDEENNQVTEWEVCSDWSAVGPNMWESLFAGVSNSLETITATINALQELVDTKQATLGFTPANRGGDTFTGLVLLNAAAQLASADAGRAVSRAELDAFTTMGAAWKDNARAATTGNITLSGLQTVDGVALAADDRVLVRAQTSAATNGIYVVAAGAWSRAADANSITKLASATVNVEEGTTLADTQYTCTVNRIGSTLGSTPLPTANRLAAVFVAGSGLTKTGNVLALDAPVATPLPASGSGALGSSSRAAREDHVHPLPLLQAAYDKIAAAIAMTSGLTTETVLHTTTIPAGMLSAGAYIDINALWNYSGNTNQKVCRVRISNLAFANTAHVIWQAIGQVGTHVSAETDHRAFVRAASVIARNNNQSTAGSTNQPNQEGSINLALPIYLYFTGQRAVGTDALSLESMVTELRT